MEVKTEGAVFQQVPVPQSRTSETRTLSLKAGELPCEMCGSDVVAYHCKRICLRCGFMTGCSEGI
jgi:hypothetical protein